MRYSLFIQFSLVLLLACNFNSFAYSQHNTTENTGSNLNSIENLTASESLSKGLEAMKVREYSLSRTYLDHSIFKANSCDSASIGILAINNIGNLFYYLNEPDSALKYFYRALDWAEKEDLLNIQNTLYNNIGIMYGLTNHPIEGRAAIEKALAISILMDDSAKMVTNLINLSAQEVEIGNTEVAENHLIRAKKILEDIQSNEGILVIYMNLGNIQYADSNFTEALKLYNIGYENFSNLHLIDKINIELAIGKTNLFLTNYEEALSHLDFAYKLSVESNNLQTLSEALIWTARCKNASGKFIEANESLNELVSIKDSIIRLEKSNWIIQSKAKHQFELRQREFEIFTENAERRTLFGRVLSIGLIIIIILLVIILRMRKKAAQLKDKKHQEENLINFDKLKKAKSKNQELKEKIETINYELVSKTLLIDNKNQILESIESVVHDAERLDQSDLNHQVPELKQHLLRDHNVEQNWEDFKIYFERINTDFFKRIHEKYPNLTSNDMRLMAFLLLEFNAKEIAQIINISPDSVRKRKQRLKEKLNIEGNENLLNHLYTFTK